jgi:hypothetical protein
VDGRSFTDGHVHGTTFIAHVLFHCTALSALRDELVMQGSRYLEEQRAKRGERVPSALLIRDAHSAARAAGPAPAPHVLEFDPRCLFTPHTSRLTEQKRGLALRDLVMLLVRMEPSLRLMLRRAGSAAPTGGPSAGAPAPR